MPLESYGHLNAKNGTTTLKRLNQIFLSGFVAFHCAHVR
jgi:hypothetical protein